MIGEKIRTLRLNRKISLNTLSELTGIKVSDLKLYEDDTKTPSLKTLIKISDALKGSLDFLVRNNVRMFLDDKPYSEHVLEALEYFKYTIDQHGAVQKELSYYEKKTQDLLHELELEDISDEGKIKTAEALKTIRKERRLVKDELQVLEFTKQFLNRNNKIIKELASVYTNTREYELRNCNPSSRKYSKRVNE